ncbi:hypothetical protein EUGRSUZ_D02481 [Eucalyptus grandis]|uniref:Uncharacterized protein n=1 Tax=Eucalyptus grandis TaxID=71139 RepID=A0A059CJD8_EUCGR|nr:hypothetical protein EUGRSUZ_D02481 [Eucalyptus grandis]
MRETVLIQRHDSIVVYVHNSICFEKWEVVLIPEKQEQYAYLIKKNTNKNKIIDILCVLKYTYAVPGTMDDNIYIY